MKTYFVSYARGDQAFVLRFAHDLKTAGVDVWMDLINLGIGQNWDRALEAAVRGSEGFIIILSPRSVASENVADEVGVALGSGKHIIPILYEPCTIPMRLARVQYIDATTDYQHALQRCTSVVLGMNNGAFAAPVAGARPVIAASAPAAVPAGWTAQALKQAELELVAFVGPVARLLVEKAAPNARTQTELYQQLAVAIPNEPERLKFLRSVNATPGVGPAANGNGAAKPGVLPADLVDKLAPILTIYLGPIARHVLASEASAAASKDDLYQRLGARIPGDKERAELLKKMRAL